MKNSFTLIEILIVIGLITVLLSFLLPISIDFYRNQQLETYSQGLLQTLRRAQLKAMSVEKDSSFGIYFTDDNYILFKGDSYNTRDSQYDEIFDLPQIITVSGLSETVFLKGDGLPKENPAYCGGVCTLCEEFTSPKPCREQKYCSWVPESRQCTGECEACESYQDEVKCQEQSGCAWYLESFGGDIILSSDSEQRTININKIGRINLE